MECEYHELSYMKASLELVDVKEEIEHLLKEKYVLDQKLERKSREQNELTEKCMRHIRVLKRKGMTSDFYCPKKRGVMVTPTKTGASSYAPNYIPSPRSYAPNYVPSPQSGTPPQAQIRNMPSQGSLLSPLCTGQLAPTTPGCSPSRFSAFHAMGGLLNSHLPTSTPQKSALPQDNKDKKSLIIKKKGAYNDGLTDKEMMDYLKEIDDEVDNDSQSALGYASHADTGNKGGGSGGKKHDATCDTVHSKHITDASAKQYDRNAVKQDDDMTSDTFDSKDDKNAVKQDDRNAVTSDTVDSKHDKNAVKQDDRYAVKLDDDMTSETVASKDDKNAVKQDNDMMSDTVHSKDKSDSSARQDGRNAAKQDDEHESDYGPDSVKRQILQGE